MIGHCPHQSCVTSVVCASRCDRYICDEFSKTNSGRRIILSQGKNECSVQCQSQAFFGANDPRWLRKSQDARKFCTGEYHEAKAEIRSPSHARLSSRCSCVHWTIAISPCSCCYGWWDRARLCREVNTRSQRAAYGFKNGGTHVHWIAVLSWRQA